MDSEAYVASIGPSWFVSPTSFALMALLPNVSFTNGWPATYVSYGVLLALGLGLLEMLVVDKHVYIYGLHRYVHMTTYICICVSIYMYIFMYILCGIYHRFNISIITSIHVCTHSKQPLCVHVFIISRDIWARCGSESFI